MRIRERQHQEDYCKKSKEGHRTDDNMTSFIWDHKAEYHSDKDIDQIDDYRFEVVECFRDPLSRQLTEGNKNKTGFVGEEFL